MDRFVSLPAPQRKSLKQQEVFTIPVRVATAALGRLLTAGALMGAACKNDSDLLTLQIQCSGPIGGLTVTADAHCNVKGYVNNPEVILHANDKGKLDVAKALDMGVLSVIKDIGLKELISVRPSLFQVRLQKT